MTAASEPIDECVLSNKHIETLLIFQKAEHLRPWPPLVWGTRLKRTMGASASVCKESSNISANIRSVFASQCVCQKEAIHSIEFVSLKLDSEKWCVVLVERERQKERGFREQL